MAVSEQGFALPKSAWKLGRFEFSSSNLLLVGVGIVVVFLALYPVGWLLTGSFSSEPPLQGGTFTVANYVKAFTNPFVKITLWNTLVFAFGQTVVSVAIGAGLGWILARTNTPGRRTFELLALIVFLIPGILAVLAYTMLFSPSKGLINQLLQWVFGFETGPFNIYTMWGMIMGWGSRRGSIRM